MAAAQKPARRPRAAGNRDGRPWKRADGRWCARVWPPAGAIDQKARYVYGASADEARQKKRDLEAKLSAGLPADREQDIATYMGRWLGETLPQYVAAGRMAPSTLDSYRDNTERHILPYLGHVRLRELSAPTVREWERRLGEAPTGRPRRKLRKGEKALPKPRQLSPRTVAYCHAILRKALSDAVRDEVAGLQRNVVSLVQPPRKRIPDEVEPLTDAEVRDLLAAASQDRFWCYWLLAIAVGFRRNEGLAMRWPDLDLDAGTWRPRLALRRLRGEPDPETGRRHATLVAAEMKSAASAKPLALPRSAVEALAEWRRAQQIERMRAPIWADDLSLVFTTRVGTAIEPRNINRQWEKVCTAAGTRQVRVHDLRHACATILLSRGVDLKTVSGTLRHARVATTEVYLHMLEDVQRGSAEVMDRYLTEAGWTGRNAAR